MTKKKCLPFSVCLEFLKNGYHVEGRGKRLKYESGVMFETNLKDGWVSYWMPNQQDILSEEWRVIYDKEQRDRKL